MNSRILCITARYVSPLLALLSLVVLYRGHNLPGGGFIGGLIGASSLMLVVLAMGWGVTRAAWWPEPLFLMVAGLGIAAISGLAALLSGQAFLTGLWLPVLEVPLLGKVKLGTPLLFDVGVYLVVVGFTVHCAQSLGKEITE